MTQLFVALDGLVDKESATLAIAEKVSLSSHRSEFGFKVNLDYLLKRGIGPAVKEVKRFNRPIFTDLKMWNGTQTMKSVIRQLVDEGVDYLNVWTQADSQLPKAIAPTSGTDTKVLGLTVLTHYDDVYCQKHFRRSLGETVRYLTEVAREVGCHGIILPGTMLDEVLNIQITKVVPGIRPDAGVEDDRHSQVVTPTMAKEKGAAIVVCGGPIMKAENPVEALKSILSELE